MNDPLRKPRKLRFRVSRALLISAPLVGSLACGEPPISVNPGPVEQLPEERVNVPAMEEPPTMQEAIGRPIEATNVVQEMEADMDGDMEEPPPRPRMVNPGPREPLHRVNPAPGSDVERL